jgi:exonuclease SbcC
MIPVQLTLKNFMSYGEHPEELSFQDFHTACLSGDNGNGKSALLDAITWAVWGRTRLSGSVVTSDESLIRTGADEMAVRFEFEAGGDRYRIIKRLKRGPVRAAASLTASVMHADGTWKKLNALQGSMQKRIDKIVGMSFDLFVQSAYLLQGRWDMFSRNTPAKRRVLVSEALGDAAGSRRA